MIKNIAYTLLFACVALASCSKEPRPMTRQEMRLKTDSIVASQNRMSEQEARKDLERRIKIEVRVKADSIFNERLHPAKAKDSSRAQAQPHNIFPKQR